MLKAMVKAGVRRGQVGQANSKGHWSSRSKIGSSDKASTLDPALP